MADKKLVFASYCSRDADLTPDVFEYLDNLEQLGPIKVWKDTRDIRAGDSWDSEIADALAKAHLAVLLVSPKFLNSKFITTHELPALRKRQERGLTIIPISLKTGPLPQWLKAIEMRPHGDLSLKDMIPKRRAAELKKIVEEIAEKLDGGESRDASASEAAPDRKQKGACAKLLSATLLSGRPDADDFARRLAGQVAQLTGLDGEGLFNATAYLVEYHLLRTRELGTMSSLDFDARGKERDALADRMKRFGRADGSAAPPIEVSSDFFSRTREREPQWKAYFDAVAESSAANRAAVRSVGQIQARLGFVAPQYLLAGLLARFDDDWRPVLNAYQSAIPRPADRNGAFESLQASQWNCWLMWGPSVPICRCEQWRGLVAFQYGYGDENNSLPVLELPDAAVPAKCLDEIAAKLCAERRGARYAALAGRLRWGPWFLRVASPDENTETEFDPAKLELDAEEDEHSKLGVAPAQSALCRSDVPANLVFQLEKFDGTNAETRVYFSAYLWMMFLVAIPPRKSEAAPAGPGLLRGTAYPDYPESEDQRQRVRDARLWEDVLPVFVHANIGDPAALEFQKRMLVENALQLLRQVWDRREELFHADDVAAGIQFHLVCASDYSGCGDQVKFPPEAAILDHLRRRKAAEPDTALAAALCLPPEDETPVTRPWGLAAYFSACHLPELVAQYYEHVAERARRVSK